MTGSIVKRHKRSWSLVLDLGYRVDGETGKRKRTQKWIAFRGTRRQAEAKLTELVRSANRGEFVEPTKMTLGEWLNEWLEKTIKPPRRAQATYDGYGRIIRQSIKPAIGGIALQQLNPLDLEHYYGARPAEKGALTEHAIIHSALKAALLAGLVSRNVAALVTNKPRKARSGDALEHVWSAAEAARFLSAAKQAGTQLAAFFALALDTGARRGELAALRWSDLDSGRLTIQRHLVRGGANPVFGQTKTKSARTVEVAAETLALLGAHKKHQAEVKIKNRQQYRDHGLMFAKEWGDVYNRADSLGNPLQVNNINAREFGRVLKAAGVRRIKFHGLRHTCATLMLQAGVPAHVVQRRLGHSKVQMTLDIYAHSLPSMQQDAADRLARLLHG